MKQGLTEIVCIIDKSGSMQLIKSDAIGAFNNFLEGQKALPGEARVTITLFDTDYCIERVEYYVREKLFMRRFAFAHERFATRSVGRARIYAMAASLFGDTATFACSGML